MFDNNKVLLIICKLYRTEKKHDAKPSGLAHEIPRKKKYINPSLRRQARSKHECPRLCNSGCGYLETFKRFELITHFFFLHLFLLYYQGN